MPGLYREIADLIERAIGMALMEDKIERALVPFAQDRAKALGLWSADVYLRRLRAEPQDGSEWSALIDVVTNGQTCFFRDADQFAGLGEIVSRIASESAGDPVCIWSSGCSTGEEPYSLAILCAELGLDARIVGSDINPASLEHATRGRYRDWSLRNVTPQRLARWFEPTDTGHAVTKEIRDSVRFVRHNLVRDPMLPSPAKSRRWHVVLCRNVLIYFRRERVSRVCQRLVGSLVPNGVFATGASETLAGIDVAAAPEWVGNRVVYRPAAAAQTPERPTPPRPRRPKRPTAPIRSKAAPQAEAGPASRTLFDRVAQMALAGDVAGARSLLYVSREGLEPCLETHLNLGHLHVCDHQLDQALEQYTHAARFDSLSPEVHYFQGVAHRKLASWDLAVEALQRALFLAPAMWQASYLLAGAYQRLGRKQEAQREQRRTRQLLTGPPPIIAFLSHPLWVEKLGVSEDELRRMWGLSPTSG